MSSPTVWATVGALGFGFVTWYYWQSDDARARQRRPAQEETRREEKKGARGDGVALVEPATSLVATPPPQKAPRVTESRVEASKEETREERVVVSVVEEREERSVLSILLEEETRMVESPKAPLGESPFEGLDLGQALANLEGTEKTEVVVEKTAEAVPEARVPSKGLQLPPKKKKGQARTTAMGLFGAPPAAEAEPAATASPAMPAAAAAAAAEGSAARSGGGVKFSFAAAEDANLKGLKRAKKVMTHGKGKARFEMQDTNAVVVPFCQDGALFCVFDGHAGKAAATACATKFPAILAQHLPPTIGGIESVEEPLRKTFADMDQALIKYEDEGATATAMVSWLSADGQTRLLQCANVGDSSAFLIRDGKAVPLTVDHKVTTPSERARVEALGIELGERATRIPGGLAVSRALGDHFLKAEKTGLVGEPSVSAALPLEAQDTHVVLASDALWDMISPEQLCVMITQSGPASAEQLAQELLAVACKSTDNATVIVLKLE